MKYTFLGTSVCKDALMKLTGIGARTLTEARQGALQGNRSWVSLGEMGFLSCVRNNAKAMFGAPLRLNC